MTPFTAYIRERKDIESETYIFDTKQDFRTVKIPYKDLLHRVVSILSVDKSLSNHKDLAEVRDSYDQ